MQRIVIKGDAAQDSDIPLLESEEFNLAAGDYSLRFSGHATDPGTGNAVVALRGSSVTFYDMPLNEIVEGPADWDFAATVHTNEAGWYTFEVEFAPPGTWSLVLTRQ
jgi:hypothetical protein